MRKPLWALAAAAVLSAAVLVALPRIPQEASYHQFADTRVILGIPNGWNVLSNLAGQLVNPPVDALGADRLMKIERRFQPYHHRQV